MARLVFDGPEDDVFMSVEVVELEGQRGVILQLDSNEENGFVETFVPEYKMDLVQTFLAHQMEDGFDIRSLDDNWEDEGVAEDSLAVFDVAVAPDGRWIASI